MMEQVVRAFIAIELPPEVRLILRQLLAKIRPDHERAVKWLDPDSIHLTLKFLGNVPEEKLSAIRAAIEQEAAVAEPCALELRGLGAFPNLRSPRVIWVGLGGEVSRLAHLQRGLDQAMVHLGFPAETREFSPHLTLGRVRDRVRFQDRIDLSAAISSVKMPLDLKFVVNEVSLIKSTLTPQGAIYDRLASVSLDKGHRKC